MYCPEVYFNLNSKINEQVSQTRGPCGWLHAIFRFGTQAMIVRMPLFSKLFKSFVFPKNLLHAIPYLNHIPVGLLIKPTRCYARATATMQSRQKPCLDKAALSARPVGSESAVCACKFHPGLARARPGRSRPCQCTSVVESAVTWTRRLSQHPGHLLRPTGPSRGTDL